ncbi:MAG: hypothetical protein KC589_04690, partial [Nanoarchaeota archaeon]|nr:hypothetical protein [Nanoarchaeota archaeon]
KIVERLNKDSFIQDSLKDYDNKLVYWYKKDKYNNQIDSLEKFENNIPSLKEFIEFLINENQPKELDLYKFKLDQVLRKEYEKVEDFDKEYVKYLKDIIGISIKTASRQYNNAEFNKIKESNLESYNKIILENVSSYLKNK